MKSKLMLGDCLARMKELPDESIDLIYADPPFNTGQIWEGEAGSFLDTWESVNDYLRYMADRLKECHRLLKPTGSIYLHCDPTISHYLKVRMDGIFDIKNFRNEIIWCYAGGGVPKKDFPRKHDVILRYGLEQRKFNVERKAYGSHAKSGGRATSLGGTRSVEYNKKGTPVNDWWSDVKPLINWYDERTGYPTQKPLALLRRIIKASSNEGDLVLDPFCGSGTTLVAAKQLQRKFIGIDQSKDAIKITKRRLQKAKRPMF